MTDIPPRPSRTPGQTCAGTQFGPPPLRDCLPRKLSAIRCVRGGKRETAIVQNGSVSFHLKSCDHAVRDARDPRRCPSTCVRRALGKMEGVWAKSEFCGQKAKFAGQKKIIHRRAGLRRWLLLSGSGPGGGASGPRTQGPGPAESGLITYSVLQVLGLVLASPLAAQGGGAPSLTSFSSLRRPQGSRSGTPAAGQAPARAGLPGLTI